MKGYADMVRVSGTTIGLLGIKKKDARNVKSTKNKGGRIMAKYRDNLYTAMEKIERLEKENKYLYEMLDKLKCENNRLYNNNIRLVREIKELGGN